MLDFIFPHRSLENFLLALLLICFPFCYVKSQDDLKKYVSIMPPNVASFEKFGNIPVAYNNGQISESISLYDFEVDANLRIPLQLSYHNDGMKPDEVPSWVGHSWNLMPAGYIVQDIKGMDDLLHTGLSNPDTKQQLNNFMLGEMPTNNRYQYIKNAVEGFADTQHDVFSLNFLGKSTKFYFDGSQIKFIKFVPFKIIFNNDQNFEVIDEKGYKYIFGLKTGCSGGMTNPTEVGPQGGSNTWSLTKIITPYGTEANFSYEQDGIYATNSSSIVYTMGVLSVDASGCLSGYKGSEVVNSSSLMRQQILQSITCNGKKVQFNTIVRNDLKTATGTTAKALSSIQVTNENNQVVKNIGFTYDNNRRLKLNEVSILDNTTNTPVQQYLFDYYRYQNEDLTSIPLITNLNRTYAIDHWGYFNGATGNTFKGVPKAKYNAIIPFSSPVTGDNDRNANGQASQMGMLKKITYPTGGYTELEYEPNEMDFGSVNAIPPFINKYINNPTVPVPGADDEVACPNYEGGGGPGIKTGTFTLNEDMNVALTWILQSTPDNGQYCSISISKPGSNPILRFGYTEEGSEDMFLRAGTYTYTLDAGCSSDQSAYSNFARFWIVKYVPQPSGAIKVTVGGNRILRIKTFDPVANQTSTQRFEYRQPEFYQIPYYVSARNMYTTDAQGPNAPPYSMNCGKQYSIGAYNLIPFEGNTIFYNSVTEYLGENGENGKNIYTYDTQALYASAYNQEPFPEITNLSWRGSDVKKVEHYVKNGDDYTMQKSTTNTYTNPPNYGSLQITNGVKLGTIGIVMTGNYIHSRYSDYYAQGQVYLPNDRYDKASVSTMEYTSNGSSILNVSNYNYNDNYFLLSKTQQFNSKGQSKEQYLWYPGDFNNNVSNIVILKANNMIGLPQKIITTNNGSIISGEVFDFDNYGNITGTYRYESNVLLPMPAHNPATLYPSGFGLKLNLSYNSSSKVKEFNPQNNMSTAILWGYNNAYPIAEVKNATYQSLVDVLGQSAIDQLSGNLPGTDNQVRTVLNQLRTDVRLKDKLVTTYTYQASVGMTSQTDPSGKITYFEYDGLGRLKLIKDQHGRILKQYDYQFQSPITQ